MRGFVIVIALALKAGLSARDDNRRPLVVEAREPSANDKLTPGLEEHPPDKHGELLYLYFLKLRAFTGSSSCRRWTVGAMDIEKHLDFFQKSIVAVPSPKVNLPSTPWVRAASTWKSVETWVLGLLALSHMACFAGGFVLGDRRRAASAAETPRSARAFTRPPAPSRGRAADGSSEPTADPSAVIDAGDTVAAEA